MLGPGDAFGEIGMVDRGAQDLYVEALEETAVCRTTRDSFLQLASRDPALALRLAEGMGEKLQEARERIADFAFRDVRGRTAHLLLSFVERERRLTGDASRDRIEPGLTHRELADIIGTRRESVTRPSSSDAPRSQPAGSTASSTMARTVSISRSAAPTAVSRVAAGTRPTEAISRTLLVCALSRS